MFKNYLNTAFRNLWKSKTYNLLNILGLAIGIACASLIFLWVEDELTFNHNFDKRDHLYRVMENQKNEGKLITSMYTPGPMAAAVKTEIRGIKNAARLSWMVSQLFKLDDKQINEIGVYADPAILTMLNIPFIYGNTANALKQPQSLLISETMSRKFFGDKNPIGETLKADGKQNFGVDGDFFVTGVFKDLPENCTYQFQWISPYEIHENKIPAFKEWAPFGICETLVELEPLADPATTNKILENYLSTKIKESSIQCFLFSMNDWNLYNHFTDGKQDGGNIKYVNLFSLIAVMILLIACINFMNLATARSEQRAKEVGVRKVLGSGRAKLIGQFIGESLLMSFLAVLVAICILYLVLPSYNLLVQKNLSPYIIRPIYFSGLIGIGLISGLIAGTYPAFYLSSFNPVVVLKGLKIKTSAGSIFIRKGLVIAQFTVSIILIISTVIIYQQVQYAKNRDLGFKKDNLIWMLLRGNLKEHYTSIRNDLLNSGIIENSALSFDEPLHVYYHSDNYNWQGKAPDSKVTIRSTLVSPEYIATMHMKLINGRDFYNTPGVDSNNIIINESLAKLMGDAGRPGSVITEDSGNLTIVGIIKDFVYNDMYGSSMPMMFRCNTTYAGVMIISFKPGVDAGIALKKTENIIKAWSSGLPFEYFFVDDEFNKIFTTETLIEKLASIFAVLAIFISCLGLLGLAAYTAQRRTKEIGIRKVLGASVPGMVELLSKDFLKLVFISCVIAFPLALWAMNRWLQDYQYRISIQWWIFPFAGLSALAIAMLTVSFQAIKAAVANPVKSLRTE
jgi:ABC-type antimicrobial peptide transport system permease subunit